MSTKMAIIDNFVTNLRRACADAGLSQKELADLSGIHYVTISRILHRKVSPSVELCERLAKAAGMRADTAFLQPEEIISEKSP